MSIKSKGTKLQKEISMVFTDVPGVHQLTTDGVDVEDYDDTTLDQAAAGRGHSPTGYAEGGSVNGQLFFDPVDTTIQSMTDDITTPAKVNWKVIWSDGAATEWPFSGFMKFLNVTADMANALVAPFSVKLDGLFTYPT